MIEAIAAAWENVVELFLDGFLALLVVAVVAPVLGVLLVLRRMPLLALAVPQTAGAGQAGLLFAWGFWAAVDPMDPRLPDAWLQLAGAGAGVILGLLALLLSSRDRSFLGVQAGVLFLVAIAARELLIIESPYRHLLEEPLNHGSQLLTVQSGGLQQVAYACVGIVLAVGALWRRLWISAFDADQARLLGMNAGAYLGVTLLLLAVLSALCVPVVGAELVLTLLLVPPAILRAATPSLRLYAPLCVLAGAAGSAAGFVMACMEDVDWPPGPLLMLSVLLASVVVALVAWIVGLLLR